MSKPRLSKTRITLVGVAFAVVLLGAVGFLVVQRDRSPRDTLPEAVRLGDIDLVRTHLEAGADPDESGALGLTPLMRAAIRDDPAIVSVLLSAGADVNATGAEGITAALAAAEAPVLGATAAFGTGAALCLNPPYLLENVYKWRVGAVVLTVVYTFLLLLFATPAGVFTGGLLPLLMVGFADEYNIWAHLQMRESNAET